MVKKKTPKENSLEEVGIPGRFATAQSVYRRGSSDLLVAGGLRPAQLMWPVLC